jgi:hypothetical protein
MKSTLLNLSFAFVAAMGMLFVNSCADPCKDVVCDNGGTCNEEGACDCPDEYFGATCETHCVNGTYGSGSCGCDDYWEGDACDIEERIKFYGAFDVVEECAPSTYEYASTIKIGTGGGINRIEISYLYNDYPDGVYADVDGRDITIPSQNPEVGFTISGSGTISEDNTTIDITYTLDDSSIGTVTCTATFTRQ